MKIGYYSVRRLVVVLLIAGAAAIGTIWGGSRSRDLARQWIYQLYPTKYVIDDFASDVPGRVMDSWIELSRRIRGGGVSQSETARIRSICERAAKAGRSGIIHADIMRQMGYDLEVSTPAM